MPEETSGEQTTADETGEQAPQTDGVEPGTGEETGDGAQQQSDESTQENPADYWKRLKRETDNRNKRLTRELEQLRRESMSEQERAIAEARDSARSEVMQEVSGRLVDAEIRSAAANRPINVDVLVDSIDRSKFLDDEGNVDRDAVSSFLDQLAPAQAEQRHASDLGQGTRGAARSDPADVFGQLITGNLR